ncbi:hypothetical protein DLAC_02705 [Tieghemostelium lacteum]|uniref:Ubiquitin-like domain-containing protein n=1 Tax=Tieghemostelium lacteum TaxID=361077 RepID=A0A152A3Q2_TIELA|nr:hypothetical protein DLAC_02705 [Tieghemostelium lacteum]|eukprot:KYR00671.1 hypothetical protein DLAC_02705 [Tieghemostelium lacteum]
MNNSNNNGTFILKILRSDTGSVYEIPVNSASILIETIKESISTVTNLSPTDQILLGDTTLLSNRTLESYGINRDKEIYLYNKKIIDNPSLRPEDIDIPIQELYNRNMYKNTRDYDNSSNLIQKLAGLEIQLRCQVLHIQYIKETFDKKLVQCQNVIYEMGVQKKASNFAINNYRDYKEKLMIKHHNAFSVNYKRVFNNCESLIQTFESDMNKLKQIKLHDSHRTMLRNTLADCIPEMEVRRWYEQCKREFESAKSKVSEYDFQTTATNDALDMEIKKISPLSLEEAQSLLKILIEHCRQLPTYLLSFNSNSEKIRKHMELIQQKGTTQAEAQNLFMSFSEIKQSQEQSLQSSNIMNPDALRAINGIARNKNIASQYSFDILRLVSRLQDKIKKISNLYPVMSETVTQLSVWKLIGKLI